LHGFITFSDDALNAFQQFYAMVIANMPGIFAK